MSSNKFTELAKINVSEKTEKKNGLTYLSWAWAWSEFAKAYPDAQYEVVKNDSNMPYFKDESGAFCYTKVTAGGITHEMWLPVMDYRNQALKNPSAFDVNKTVMRCLTKNLAMFGLGLYIYAGEDLPEGNDEKKQETRQQKMPPPSKASDNEKRAAWESFTLMCNSVGVDPMDFLASQADLSNKDETYGVVRKWLANEQQLIDQLMSYSQA